MGESELILTDNDGSNNWQSGLELMKAQPKARKNSRLALLSGGEKTLTALSLVFAIFKQQPAPFCVLDEVRHPAGFDANVERFTNLIRELAKEVQFIFISHNKHMQIADELKGVTMPTLGFLSLLAWICTKLSSIWRHNIRHFNLNKYLG